MTTWKKDGLNNLLQAGWMLREEDLHTISNPLLIQAYQLAIDTDEWWQAAESLTHLAIGFRNDFRTTGRFVQALLAKNLSQAAYNITVEKKALMPN